MALQEETITFLIFVFLGMVYSFIFDFFRAIRKYSKPSSVVVTIQDIIYFIIVGIMLIVCMLSFVKEQFRFYLLLSIMLGVSIYIGVIGNSIMLLIFRLINVMKNIIQFVFIPFLPFKNIFDIFLAKNVTNCCKKIKYMVQYFCSDICSKRLFKLKGDNNGKKRSYVKRQ